MTHYIKDSKNRIIIDAESSKNDLHVSLDVVYYSVYLLGLEDVDRQAEFIFDINSLLELRATWFEMPKSKRPLPKKYLK